MHTELEKYYNKFNEEKRLLSRHGQVEYTTTMRYIHECLRLLRMGREPWSATKLTPPEISILDIGAGTGRYSVALSEEGYDVTAVELVKYNLGILKQKKSTVKAYQGNAMNLKRFEGERFDVTLLFGPMYHLHDEQDKLRALNEAKRVTKTGGYILVAYCMNDYSVLTYAFKEKHILECLERNTLTPDYHVCGQESELYEYVRIEDIKALSEKTGLRRVKLVTPDGPADYMRPVLNEMDEESFQCFLEYVWAISAREDMIGAASHTVDILQKVNTKG